ncbi:MAG: recombinase family protein [Planctomycetia bacterium]|jgi:DNA invertase Pin-like site-specific DNA recombinase
MSVGLRDKHPLSEKRVVAYLRVSKDTSQSDRQREGINEWARLNGIRIARFYCDDQGSNPRDMAEKRSDFQQMLRDVQSSLFDALVVFEQDRFGFKDVAQFWAFINILRDNGVELWSVKDGNLSGDDAGTVFMATAGALTSTEEVKTKGHRSLSKKILLARAGQWTGGYPPYGLDVVCKDERGDFKWRLVWVGHHRRIRIGSDGSEQAYDGKGNVPGRDERDVPVFSPSIRAERLEVVRQVFEWFVNESISPSQIAARLNDLKRDPVFGEEWNKQKIKMMLLNPAYVGHPCINKRGGSRYWEYVDGQLIPVRSIKGRIKGGRKRKREDHVGPSTPVFDPLVPPDLFEQAQRRLEARSRAYREKVPATKAPRVAAFWLRNLLICAGCNAPMRACNSHGAKAPYRSYSCGTYGTVGRQNKAGCRSNRIKAEVLEGLVDRYLAEAHKKILAMLESHGQQSRGDTKGEDAVIVEQEEHVRSIRRRIRTAVIEHESAHGFHVWGEVYAEAAKHTETVIVEGREVTVMPVTPPESMFRYLQSKKRPELEKELQRLDDEHTELVDRVLALKSVKAIEKANAKIGAIEERMNAIRSLLTDWVQQMEELADELASRRQAIQEAGECIGQDGWYRRKAEVVRQVISRLVAHFEPTEGRSNQPRSRLTQLDIIPVEGKAFRCYPEGTPPGRD